MPRQGGRPGPRRRTAMQPRQRRPAVATDAGRHEGAGIPLRPELLGKPIAERRRCPRRSASAPGTGRRNRLRKRLGMPLVGVEQVVERLLRGPPRRAGCAGPRTRTREPARLVVDVDLRHRPARRLLQQAGVDPDAPARPAEELGPARSRAAGTGRRCAGRSRRRPGSPTWRQASSKAGWNRYASLLAAERLGQARPTRATRDPPARPARCPGTSGRSPGRSSAGIRSSARRRTPAGSGARIASGENAAPLGVDRARVQDRRQVARPFAVALEGAGVDLRPSPRPGRRRSAAAGARRGRGSRGWRA